MGYVIVTWMSDLDSNYIRPVKGIETKELKPEGCLYLLRIYITYDPLRGLRHITNASNISTSFKINLHYIRPVKGIETKIKLN